MTTRWHRLIGTTERYVILSGQGRVEIGDLPPREVGSDDVVLIPPLCRQRITNTGADDLIFLREEPYRPSGLPDEATGSRQSL